MSTRLVMTVDANRAYDPHDRELSAMSLRELKQMVDGAIEDFGEDAEVVIETPRDTARFGSVSYGLEPAEDEDF